MKTCWNLFDKSIQGFLTFLWGDTPPIETPCLDLALRLAIIHLVHEWRLNAIKRSMTCVPVLNRLDDDWMQSMRRLGKRSNGLLFLFDIVTHQVQCIFQQIIIMEQTGHGFQRLGATKIGIPPQQRPLSPRTRLSYWSWAHYTNIWHGNIRYYMGMNFY